MNKYDLQFFIGVFLVGWIGFPLIYPNTTFTKGFMMGLAAVALLLVIRLCSLKLRK